MRIGATNVATERFDLTRGAFTDRAEHADAVAAGLWRGTVGCSDAELAELGELVLALGGVGPVVDVEPWVLVSGTVR